MMMKILLLVILAFLVIQQSHYLLLFMGNVYFLVHLWKYQGGYGSVSDAKHYLATNKVSYRIL